MIDILEFLLHLIIPTIYINLASILLTIVFGIVSIKFKNMRPFTYATAIISGITMIIIFTLKIINTILDTIQPLVYANAPMFSATHFTDKELNYFENYSILFTITLLFMLFVLATITREDDVHKTSTKT